MCRQCSRYQRQDNPLVAHRGTTVLRPVRSQVTMSPAQVFNREFLRTARQAVAGSRVCASNTYAHSRERLNGAQVPNYLPTGVDNTGRNSHEKSRASEI
ncbi:hypothetical protein QE152_g38229 [Popillia japonica]|uniref:Uncharacterized protein n=1 Tax=Popillia japonica TaxID=7064 RepID=A0AAW1I7F8_POPJA